MKNIFSKNGKMNQKAFDDRVDRIKETQGPEAALLFIQSVKDQLSVRAEQVTDEALAAEPDNTTLHALVNKQRSDLKGVRHLKVVKP
jgi:hypothetical protein